MWAVFLLHCHDSVLSGTLVGLFLVSGPFLYTGPGLSLASWEFLRAAEGPGRLRWSSAELIQLTGCSFSRETVNRRLEVTTEGLLFMEDPQSPTPQQAPHKSIWKNVYNSCSIFASTWQNSATWWSHRAKIFTSSHMFKFLFHMFNFHSVYLFHISSAFFCIYVFLYFQLLLDFFAYIQVFIPHVHLSHIFSFLPINSGVFVYIDISFQILNFHSVYLRFLFLYVQLFC